MFEYAFSQSAAKIAQILLAFAILAGIPSLAVARDSVVVFNEAHYYPANDDTSLEYIELHNQLAVEVDISNWRIDGDIDFDFPEGTLIDGGGYLVIAKNPAALSAATGYSGALGPYNRDLSNSGDPIYLYNNNRSFRSQSGSGPTGEATDEIEGRRIMDELFYLDRYPWPLGPDGSGFSLAKRDPDTATADPVNWTSSSQKNGTPGTANTFTALPALAFNEVTSSFNVNFQFELHNYGSTSIALGGLVIASSNPLFSEYTLPASNLAEGAFLTIDAATLGFVPEDNNRLFLYNAGKTSLIDTVRVDNSATARAPDGTGPWSRPASLTLGSANDVSIEDGIVINEIFYSAKAQIASGGSSTTSLEVLDYDSTWRYNLDAGTSGLLPGWAGNSHTVDNISWAAGPGLLGVENAILGEPIQTSTILSAKIPYYFETEFTYSDAEPVTEMLIHHYIDDGAIFYLNGAEIGRFNMDEGDFTATTAANPGVGNATPGTLTISSPQILQGSNRLSVEVHQINTGSSDVVFGARVSLKKETTSNYIPYAERDEEWIELYNRSGDSIDLTGWELDGGIRYKFPASTSIPSGGYLVIAKDAPALLAKHSSSTIIGGYSGRLGNSGDLIVLEDSIGNIADEVRYYDSGKWHSEADGGGSSLELRDPDADNAIAEAWAASEESARNHWQTYSYEDVAIDDGIGLDVYHELQIGMLDAGELLIDDVSVLENDTIEFIQNGGFDSDAVGATADKWRAIGTHGSHGKTIVVTDPDDSGNKCLHLVSTGPTENKHNKLETTFASGEQVVPGNTYRISFRAKWLKGSSQLNTKLYFNYVQRTHTLDSAETWGTPGTVNTAAVPNAGPDLSGLTHSPVVPDANQAVTVGIDATDPDGISDLTLFYSVNGGAYQSAAMTQVNGRFTGGIPAQGASSIVRFYVHGTDSSSAISDYPAAASEGGAFYKVQDGLADTSGLRHNFRIIMAESDRAFLFLNTNRMSNDRIPATVIEDEETVYYDVRLRLKASAFGRYRTSNYGFNIRFQPDQLFRGVHPGLSVERGQTNREILSKYLMNRAGGGYWSFYDDVAYIITPTAGDRGVGLLSLSRHTGKYWDSLFPDSEEKGTLFNLELHYAPNGTTGGPEGLKIGNPFNLTRGRYRLEDRGNDKEPYRWGFQIRSARDRDDYSQIIALNQAVGNLSGSALKEALDPIIDVNQWMRTFAMMSLNGSTDVYGRVHEHNFRFFVRPTDGRIIVMQWDLDSAFALATNGPVVPTVNRDGTAYSVAKLFTIPEYRRIFDGHLDDLIQTTFNSDYVTSISGELSTAIGASINYSGYITNRANFIQSTLPSPAAFAITTNGGNAFSEPDSAIDLAGNGSYDVFAIEVNGAATPLTWIDADSWKITVPISLGPNELELKAINHQGGEVGSDSITVTNTSDIDLANASNTIISELHYHPSDPSAAEEAGGFNNDDDFEFVELMNTSDASVDYTNVNFTNGLTFTIPVDTILAPGERVILVHNQSAFEFRYGVGIARIVGEYTGTLSNGGERVRLAAADATTIVDFTYSDISPWPESPDGDGYSLIFMGSDANDPLDWRPSATINGNPGDSDSTSIQFVAGSGTVNGLLEAGDSNFFTFTTTGWKHVEIKTSGNVDTFGSLRDSAADLLNDPIADDNLGADENFLIDQFLPAGTYTVEVTGKGASPSGAYQLVITETMAIVQPDNEVGKTATRTIGDGVYGTGAGQTLTLISKKARTVSGVATIENDGELPDDFTVRGSRGNGLFKVTYTSYLGNVTAAVVAGTYQTGELDPGIQPHTILVTVKPNKKKIVKKLKRGGRRRTVVKKKLITLAVRSVSMVDGTKADTGFIKTKTK